MTLVHLKQVSFGYRDGVSAIDGIELSIGAGNLIAIAGANGSGKSTLVAVLARVLEASGEILYRGRSLDAWDRREYARSVGYLPQVRDVVFPMRAVDVVVSGRAPYLSRFRWETGADLEIARHALERCDASHLSERFVDEMSGGERQRVLLARVLAGDPELILLDEPLTALDVSHVEKTMLLLRELVDREKKTIVVVSHELNWSSAYADRIVLMRDGRVVEEGKPADVVRPEILRTVFDFDATVTMGSDRIPWVLPRPPRS